MVAAVLSEKPEEVECADFSSGMVVSGDGLLLGREGVSRVGSTRIFVTGLLVSNVECQWLVISSRSVGPGCQC